MVKIFKLFIATSLALVSTLALSYTTIILPRLLDSQLKAIYPDLFYHPDHSLMEEFVNQVRPIGYASFLLAVAMIIIGFISNRKRITSLGVAAFFLPTFANFAYSMFFLAGLGITRIMWIPLIDTYPLILRFGDIALVPLIPVAILNLYGWHDLTWLSITLAGLAIFFVGVVTWFYAKLEGRDVISFWVYKYSRHPQYLGLIVMSYGFMLGVSRFTIIANKEFFTTTQSFPWVISTLILVCVAFTEEIEMLRKHDKTYEEFREKTPFMLPLPGIVSKVLTAPARWFLGTDQPTNRKEIAYYFVIYCVTSAVLSIPVMLILA
jgi:protein-S-isoprenylcysteine O-methyltransferase Ste14